MTTLIDVFRSLEERRGEFVIHDDGYRVRRFTYAQVTRAARGGAARLAAAGLGQGDKMLLWGENCAEWLACYWGATGLKRLLRVDDSLDVFGVHGIGGIVGSLLTGVLASRTVGGVPGSLLTQAIGVGAVMAYSLVVTAALLWLVNFAMGLRVDEQSEQTGLDIAQHREHLGG